MQRYRSGHNGADSKSVWSNPRGFESHPLRHISRLTLIELDGNFLYSKQFGNTHILCKNRIFAEIDYFGMCISLKLPLFSRVANSGFRVTNRGFRVTNSLLRVANRVCV